MEKDEEYIKSVTALGAVIEDLVKANNAVDIYEEYFAGKVLLSSAVPLLLCQVLTCEALHSSYQHDYLTTVVHISTVTQQHERNSHSGSQWYRNNSMTPGPTNHTTICNTAYTTIRAGLLGIPYFKAGLWGTPMSQAVGPVLSMNVQVSLQYCHTLDSSMLAETASKTAWQSLHAAE